MSHIFISYSRKNIDLAGKIVQALADNALDTWIDWKSIPKGEDWEQEIYRGIEEADAFLFLISPDSVVSQMCNKEIVHAVKNGKRILPIVLRDTELNLIDSEISKRNWIFCREGQDNFAEVIDEIQTTIHTDFEWLKYHTKLQIKALDWAQGKDHSRLLRGKELQAAEQKFAEFGNQKDPQPTKVQREYVLISRRNEERLRWRITLGLCLGLIILAIVAGFAWIQRDEAQRQAKIAIARQLASQAQLINTTYSSKQMISTLLYIQSMKLFSERDAANFLLNNNNSALLSSGWMYHYDNVNSVAFSPDGKYVASGSDDNTARVWEIDSGEEIVRMNHDSGVTSVAFSPDGKYVVSGSRDNTVRVWEATTGKEVARMIHGDTVYSVAFSPDGKYVASGSDDNTARVWEIDSGEEIVRMNHDSGVTSVAFSPDGKYMALGSDDNTARVREIDSGEEIARMTHDNYVTSVAFSPDGKYVVSGSGDSTARVWEIASGKEIARMTHYDYVSSVAFSPDGKYVVSAGCDIEQMMRGVGFCRFGAARVWEVANRKEIVRMNHDSGVTSVAFSPDGKYVASGSDDNTARVWEIDSGEEIARMTHDDYVTSVAFSPDGKYVVSGSGDSTARVWEIASGKEIIRMVNHNSGVTSVNFSPDGNYVISRYESGIILLRELSSGKENVELINRSFSFTGPLLSIAFSPDGKYVVSESEYDACVWEVTSWNQIACMTHDDYVTSVAFSPDGKYVVSGGRDSTVLVWEIASGKEVAHISYDDYVTSVAFSPDGKYVVVGNADNTARVWEVASRKEIARMKHDNFVLSVSFSPDGKYIVSGSWDGTVRVWVWRTEDLITNACKVMPRNLTRAEWDQYIGDALPYQAVCSNLPIEPESTPTP